MTIELQRYLRMIGNRQSMKPRQKRARLTKPDHTIWKRLVFSDHGYAADGLTIAGRRAYFRADARDAEIMLALGNFCRVCDDPPVRHLACGWWTLGPAALELRQASA